MVIHDANVNPSQLGRLRLGEAKNELRPRIHQDQVMWRPPVPRHPPPSLMFNVAGLHRLLSTEQIQHLLFSRLMEDNLELEMQTLSKNEHAGHRGGSGQWVSTTSHVLTVSLWT